MSRGTCHCASCDGRAPEFVTRPLDESDAELLADYARAERRGVCHHCAAPAATCLCGAVAYLAAVDVPGELDADEARERCEIIRRATEFAGLVALEDDPSAARWAWGVSDATDTMLRGACERAEVER